MSITNLEIPNTLNTSKDSLIENFFIPLLKNSIKYDRGVGYFSSSWITEAYEGMIHFAKNNGKARWITSPILSKQDWDAIQLGDKARQDDVIKEALFKEIEKLSNSMNKDTLISFAWMIADNIIDIKLAKPKNKLVNEFHAKIGIFTDTENNSLSFDGSYNDSLHGLFNYESIKVFRSWDESKGYVDQEIKSFEAIWEGNDPNIEVYKIPDAALSQIIKIRELSDRPYPKPDSAQLLSSSFLPPTIETTPQIPLKLTLRQYQLDAINKWVENKYHGVFEMATGTGKTITALAAAIRLFEENQKIFIVIICPYIHLAQQWVDEAAKFNFSPILVAESKTKWLEKVYKLARDFSHKSINHGLIITTNASFLTGALREVLEKYNIWENCLLIADEMHHCGTNEMLKVLPADIDSRLGLSATPIRGYDEEGTELLLKYFGDIVYQFGLKEAIEQGFLTPYTYHPYPVYLQDDEFDEFIQLTNRLSKLHPDPGEPISENALMVAIKRSRILNNSRSKIQWVEENIPVGDESIHTLYYVGDKIFDEVLNLLGTKKQMLVHEFTHRQTLRERSELLVKFTTGTIQAFVAMKCLDEGVDVPPTRVAYFLASSTISREFIQRRGRILRNFPGKKQAIVYDLISVPPKEYIVRGKNDENYKAVRSAIRREYTRIREFAALAENKHQALDYFFDIANKFGLLDI